MFMCEWLCVRVFVCVCVCVCLSMCMYSDTYKCMCVRVNYEGTLLCAKTTVQF